MKSIILATTALVASAGIAAAGEITLNAGANFGVKYMGGPDTTTVHNELDFGINATGESDGGVAFGASIDLDSNSDEQVVTSSFGDPEAFISFGGLTLTVGEVDAADDFGGYADVGYDGIGVDGEMKAGGDHNVLISYSVSDYTFSASTGSASDDFALGFQGAAGPVSFKIGYNSEDSTSTDVTHLTLGYSSGDVSTHVYVESVDTGATATNYGLDVIYSMNAMTITFAAADGDSFAEANYGIGASYDLGGGLAIAGGVGKVAGNTNADFGVTMKF